MAELVGSAIPGLFDKDGKIWMKYSVSEDFYSRFSVLCKEQEYELVVS